MLADKPMQALISETNRVLGLAVDHGLRDNRPPPEMISKLRNDVFVFSACKTHIQLKEIGSKLVDENGKINGYQKFSQEVSAIHKAYNEQYLQAEYIFATSSAEMAAKWSRFERDGDRYNLQYRTAQDNRVRDAHAKLAGTTLPVSDPFWDSYYPPNGWRCRCIAVQVLKEKYPESNSTDSIKTADKETTQIDSKGRDRNAMFRFNPGKQQVIFPPNHPYYKVKQGISNILGSLVSTRETNDFETVKSFENGGKIEVHRLANRKAGDYDDVYNCCDFFAKQGKRAQIYPKINPTENHYESVYSELKGTIYWGRSPDFKVNGVFYELEGYTTNLPDEGTIAHMLKRGANQSSKIVIKHVPGTSHHFYRKKVYDKLNQKNSKAIIDEVWVMDKKEVTLIYKKQ
ncbi:MAG: phage minor head protein [Bacteroidetes bacterium]|nr:phage minor head protein [Bacteroidota bacterium]